MGVGLASLLRSHPCGPRLPALLAAQPPQLDRRGVLAFIRILVLDLAGGYLYDELGLLVRIAGSAWLA
jgi:hypothetical protein